MSILGGIVAGVGSLLGGVGSSAMNNKAVQDTNKANMEIAKYQAQWQQQENEKAYQRSLKMWNLQNEYNSPTQQMARIRAAGLNPNLVYGNGVTGNSAGSTPQYEPAKFNAPTMQAYRGWNLGISDATSQYLAYRTVKAQVDNMEAQNSLIRQQTATEATRQANIAASTSRSEFDLNMAKELKDVSVSSAIAEMNQKQAVAAQGWTKANREVVQYELDKALFDNKIKLNNEKYLKALQSVRQLTQDNDINAFRYRIEKITGKGPLLDDLIRRLLTILAPNDFDRLFNPK
ncbi:hypothetical protein [Parabacteroides distasonis]|uniref:hypothetical protein n=1 Tax=Parabacteroides distasonis TaxID=823 RepID=UPI0004DA1B50|nr:hypothetical protein [Parabacteroides distasonis]KDS61827.1 hypothetical protein M095_3809 [Parabacteroides distasonis str. 3999B T(B) 4]KDS63785.1 hypothetical protein M095_3404 [Parabacteroides distasonis str. 3999B T(B) 4]KDS65545.1 hypothetical protein M096_4689 [Parabacteroides distasonis str. 3999B T(B) 6]KDS66875.1 hypothetical protein M095_2448 [Parabacteroides distasonis str. 3999B T(B) 4]KDS67303.1 hypothetical protein M095_2410 [Parabacteroides distasonis str. 3999B T(B) 4]